MFRLLNKLFLLAITLFVVCLILIAGAAYLAFSEVPNQENFPYDFSTMKAVSTLNYKLKAESSFLFSNTSSSRNITLSKDELNAAFILYTGGNIVTSFFNAKQEKQYDSLKLNSGCFDNGEFTLCLTQKVPYKIPFGSYLNFVVKGVPEIRDNKLIIKINSFKVGRLRVSALVLNLIIKIEDNKINNLNEVKMLINAVEEFKTQNDGIYLVYYPDRFSWFLSYDFINSLKIG